MHRTFIGPTLETHILCISKKGNDNCETDIKNKISTKISICFLKIGKVFQSSGGFMNYKAIKPRYR